MPLRTYVLLPQLCSSADERGGRACRSIGRASRNKVVSVPMVKRVKFRHHLDGFAYTGKFYAIPVTRSSV
jgi:hypothetical protein